MSHVPNQIYAYREKRGKGEISKCFWYLVRESEARSVNVFFVFLERTSLTTQDNRAILGELSISVMKKTLVSLRMESLSIKRASMST